MKHKGQGVIIISDETQFVDNLDSFAKELRFLTLCTTILIEKIAAKTDEQGAIVCQAKALAMQYRAVSSSCTQEFLVLPEGHGFRI